MKKLIFLFSVCLLISCSTAKLVTVSSSENVIEINGTKPELYIKANEWMVKVFKSAKSVIQFQDREGGTIIGKYLMHEYPTATILKGYPGLETYAVIKISVRDNAAKISIEPQNTWYYGQSGLTNYNYSPETAKIDIDNLIQDFKSFMQIDNKW